MDVTVAVVGTVGALVWAYQYSQRPGKTKNHRVELNIWGPLKLCMTIFASGVLVVLGIVLVVLLFTWPLGMLLIAYAGKLPLKQLKAIHERSEAALNEQKLQDTVETTDEEGEMPWAV